MDLQSMLNVVAPAGGATPASERQQFFSSRRPQQPEVEQSDLAGEEEEEEEEEATRSESRPSLQSISAPSARRRSHGGGGGGGEDRTVELEPNLDALMRQVETRPAPAAKRLPLQPEETVQLEFDLQALVGSAGGQAGAEEEGEEEEEGVLAALPRGEAHMMADDSDDDATVEYDEEDAQAMRLSVESVESVSSFSPVSGAPHKLLS